MKKLAALILLAAVGAGVYATQQLTKPWKGFGEPVLIEFPRGTSTSQMASMLAEQGVIEHPWLFLAARVARRGALQAGEYQFTKAASPLDVYGRIARGDIYYMELLVPEGFNMFDVADAVSKLGTMSAATFLEAARDPAPIRDLDPKAETLEGYLFPNKYRVYRKTTAREICRMMTNEFRAQWQTLAGSGNGVHDAVTLASLVEREARLPEERPLVSSVFHNRLRIGMRLQCDPTTVYAALLEDRYRGVIHQSDLDNQNPYNTYQHAGLPPGPIANPGLSSIKAALSPEDTPYLFFVAKADGSGGHNFSDSLQQHVAAVARYHRASGH